MPQSKVAVVASLEQRYRANDLLSLLGLPAST
jgi:hypothetical protein